MRILAVYIWIGMTILLGVAIVNAPGDLKPWFILALLTWSGGFVLGLSVKSNRRQDH